MTVVEVPLELELFPALKTEGLKKMEKDNNLKTPAGDKPPRRTRKPSLNLADRVDAAEIVDIFEYWKTVHDKKRAKLDDNRRAYIARGILEYGTEACMEAIKGCSLSDWHMGTNPGSKFYNSIELILRDSEHVERSGDHFFLVGQAA